MSVCVSMCSRVCVVVRLFCDIFFFGRDKYFFFEVYRAKYTENGNISWVI